MSLISDVEGSLARLDSSSGRLRRFGCTVGPVFLMIALGFGLRGHHPVGLRLALAVGAPLLLAGLLLPTSLRPVHRAWMGGSLVLGWLSSRVILIVLFACVLTPLALVARLFGKQFLEGAFPGRRAPGALPKTRWVARDPERKIDYEKMY